MLSGAPYTLSFSAINTWAGEELRTIGTQYTLDWLGIARGHRFEFNVSAAAFGWNDTAGTVLASRGWGLVIGRAHYLADLLITANRSHNSRQFTTI